jgi:hypothetical protein
LCIFFAHWVMWFLIAPMPYGPLSDHALSWGIGGPHLGGEGSRIESSRSAWDT